MMMLLFVSVVLIFLIDNFSIRVHFSNACEIDTTHHVLNIYSGAAEQTFYISFFNSLCGCAVNV